MSFLQIGANCGKNTYNCAAGGDPVWPYATSCGWRGLALEPVSYVFLQLCRNYLRWLHRVTPLRAAVADAPGRAAIELGAGETNKLLQVQQPRTRANETVPVVDLHTLWRHARAVLKGNGDAGRFHIDILAIDAEGAEARILGVRDAARAAALAAGSAGSTSADPTATKTTTTRPTDSTDGLSALPRPLSAMILFEHAHLSRAELVAIDVQLTRHGYVHLKDLRNQDPRGRHLRPVNRLYGHAARRRGARIER